MLVQQYAVSIIFVFVSIIFPCSKEMENIEDMDDIYSNNF